MTMFQELYALATSATLTLIVSADEHTGRLTISVLPKPKKDMGEAALTKDLTLTASPEDFDTGFVSALRDYREVRTSLLAQAEATCEALLAAKSASTRKASEATATAAKSAPAGRAQVIAKAEHADDGADEQEAAPAPVGQEREPALGESFQLFG